MKFIQATLRRARSAIVGPKGRSSGFPADSHFHTEIFPSARSDRRIPLRQGWCWHLLTWLYFPPLSSFILLFIAAIFHNREQAYSLPVVLLGGLTAAYLCLCAVSIFYISARDKRYLGSICCLAQALLLMTISLQMGSTFFAWIGMVLLLMSLIVVFFHVTGGSRSLHDAGEAEEDDEERNAQERERTENLLAKLALPICITDSKGIVLGATPRFFEAAGREPGEIEGEIIEDILPLDRGEVLFESGAWWIEQAQEGARHYFSLLPTKECRPVREQAPAFKPAGLSIQDPATGLYIDEYRKIRGPEEVARAQRYRRWLSGLLIELNFDGADNNIGLPDKQREMLFNAFAQKVKGSLRSMDCGFLMPSKQRVQILLPETPQTGAKTLLGRLMLIPQDAFDEDVRNATRPSVKGCLFFFNGNPPMDYNIFSAALEESFAKMKDAGDS